ncbi:MAG: hypothetical protein KDB80_16250 [Planctomycetes bacterium]|nr:hypothetical protein [Planctomycetota bacterium]
MNLLVSLSAVALSVSLSGQQVLIVDSAGGGGFTDIPPAIAAASPGDAILVRTGAYTGFSLDKGLKLVFEPGTEMLPAEVYVNAVPVGQTVVLSGLRPNTFFLRWFLTNNEGRILVEDSDARLGLTISSCAQVSLERVDIQGGVVRTAPPAAVSINDSTVLMTDCLVTGGLDFVAVAGVNSTNSDVVIADCSITGGVGFSTGGGPGLRVTNGLTTVAGDSSTVIAAGSAGTVPQPAIARVGGTMWIDPGVSLVPHAGAAPITGPTPWSLAMAFLRGDYTNGQLTLQLHSSSHAFGVVFASLPGQVLPFPPTGWWLGATAFQVGTAQTFVGGVTTTSLAVNPFPLGTDLAFQGIVVDANGVPALSTPVLLTLD